MSREPREFDALMPPAVAVRAEELGVKKATNDATSLFLLAVLAGAFIAVGALFSTTASVGAESLGFGPAKVLAGLVFCAGLVFVVVAGAELFTGNNLIVMSWASGRVSTAQVLRNWGIVYVGNFVGALVTALLVYVAEQHTLAGGAVGGKAVGIGLAKVQLSFTVAFSRGILCNALVCLAVWLTLSCRSTGDKILAILFPITAFVATGMEHCIANMYFIPMALFIDGGTIESLTWSAFFVKNLVPVTLGNIVGGSLMVGGLYWVIYLRGRKPDE